MARRSPPLQKFDMNAAVAANFARPPMDDGEMWKAAGRAVANVGDILAKIAADAEARDQQAAIDTASAEGAKAAAGTVDYGAAGQGEKSASGGVTGNAGAARAYFEAQGWSPVQAAAIVGNLYQESGLRTTAANPNDPGTSVGIGQWNRERKAGLMAFAQAKGADWRDFNTQLAFVQHELTSSEKQAGDRLKSATTLDDAVAAAIGYERPAGWTADNPRAGHGFANRLRFAQSALGAKAAPVAAPRDTAAASAGAIPQIRPLQLRRDGTPQGAAYDAAVLKAGAYNAKAAMTTGLDMLGEQFKDDPAGFEKEAEKLRKQYVDAFAQAPELQATADAEFHLNYEPVRRKIYAQRDTRADAEMKQSAATAVQAQGALLEKQAYAIGVNADGDAQLAAISSRAMTVIDSAAAAGGITAAQAVREKQEIVRRLVQARFDGVFDALKTPAEKQAFAEKMASPETRDELLKKLPLDDYHSLVARYKLMARQAAEQADATSRVEQQKMKRLVDDDIASLAATGKGVAVGGLALAHDEVASVLGPEAADQWQAARQKASQIFAATDGLARLTPQQIGERLKSFEPQAGAPGFADAADVFDKATRVANNILRRRADDPAAAVDEAFPDLQDSALRKDPAALVRARMDHQAALDIPELARQPLTNAEAMRYADRLKLYQGTQDGLEEAAKGLTTELGQAFGDYADEALAQVLRVNGISRESSVIAVGMMKDIVSGTPPSPAAARQYDGASARDAADQAMAGRLPRPGFNPRVGHAGTTVPRKPQLPNAAQIEMLRNGAARDPGLVEWFDRKFGKGTAEGYLKPRGDQARRVLPDGSVEIVYDDGWIETLHPDGSVDGRQGP
jgi:hypothetical protein